MARVFFLFEDEAGRQTGRGDSFTVVLAYVLRDAAPQGWHGTEGLSFPIGVADTEMGHTYHVKHLDGQRRGPRTTRPVLHAALGWHADDLAWLTREHVEADVRAALRHIRLAGYQCVWVLHTDTGRPHVHLVVNLIHPESGDVARIGLTKKRMSEFCAAYEQRLGDVRCKRRFVPKAANENRARLSKAAMLLRKANKQKASLTPAPRP